MIVIKWNLSKADSIGTMNWRPLYGIVRFIEIVFDSLTEFDQKTKELGEIFVCSIENIYFMMCTS